jgi:hydrogenase maturation factor
MDGDRITVECKGKRAGLKSFVTGLAIGDYVIFSSNIAVDKIEKEEALLILGDRK